MAESGGSNAQLRENGISARHGFKAAKGINGHISTFFTPKSLSFCVLIVNISSLFFLSNSSVISASGHVNWATDRLGQGCFSSNFGLRLNFPAADYLSEASRCDDITSH